MAYDNTKGDLVVAMAYNSNKAEMVLTMAHDTSCAISDAAVLMANPGGRPNILRGLARTKKASTSQPLLLQNQNGPFRYNRADLTPHCTKERHPFPIF